MSRLTPSRSNRRARSAYRHVPAAITWMRDMRRVQGGSVTLLLLVTAVLSVTLFLVQVFQTSAQGLEISQMDHQTKELRAANEQLTGKASELASLTRIEKVAGEIGMVRGGQPVYLSGYADGVAYNR